jgi:hypothetical protein
VKQWVSNDQAYVACPQVDSLVNEWAQAGWTPHSIVPGSNAQTHAGLFVTLQRPII